MTVQNLPNTGDMLFLMHREVIVTKVYIIFQLIKIRYTEESSEFFVDACMLTNVPSSSPELFRFAQKSDKPSGNELWIYSIVTNDKAKKYNSQTNNLPFDAHPTVTQGNTERIINLYIATPIDTVA